MLLRKENEMATYSNWPASKPLNTAQIECIISGFTRRHTRDYDSPFPGNALRNHILQMDNTLEKPEAFFPRKMATVVSVYYMIRGFRNAGPIVSMHAEI